MASQANRHDVDFDPIAAARHAAGLERALNVDQMSNIQQLKKQVEQLRREAAIERMPVSRASQELRRYAEEHQAEDILCTGFQNQKENPFREKSSCSIL